MPDPSQISDQATAAVLAAAAPYVKFIILGAITWAVGKAQQQGGPIVWIGSLFGPKK